MRKILPTTLLGVAGLTAFGLIAMSAPVVAAAADEAAKRDDDATELVLVADDDDDDTNDDDDDGDDAPTPAYTGAGRDTNDNTNSGFTGVSRDRDNSRGDKTRDWTRDGGDQTRDHSANQHQRPLAQRHPRLTDEHEDDAWHDDDSWHLAEGDRITPELTALRRLGGGSAYEAYSPSTRSPSRRSSSRWCGPRQVDDESTLRGLRREVEALAAVNHPVVVRGLRDDLEGERPHVVLEHIDGPRLSTPDPALRPAPGAAVPPAGDRGRRRAALLPPHRLVAPRHQAQQRHHGRARAADRPLGRPPDEDAAAARATRSAPTPTCRPSSATRGAERRARLASDVWGLGATLFHAVAGYRAFDARRPRRGRPAGASPSSSTSPTSCPTTCRPRCARSSRRACAATPPTPAARTRSPTPSSRCSPACRAPR